MRPASRSTSPNSGTSGEDDRRRSNAEFKWSRKCVGFEVGRTARRSERELLVLFDTDCRRLLNGSLVGGNSANNGFRYMQGSINETFHYHFGIKNHAVLVLLVVSYHDWLLDFGYECSMDFRHRKMSPCGTLSVIVVMD